MNWQGSRLAGVVFENINRNDIIIHTLKIREYIMLIHEIVEYCNTDTTHLCGNCNHPSACPGSCKSCLKQIHFPLKCPDGKKDYDCENMINFYICDYTNKYASEMLYLLRKSEKLKEINEYHILSIGCGAAPDLMAFEKYAYDADSNKDIRYFGVDVNSLWQPIHNKIMNYSSGYINSIKFVYDDAIKYFNKISIPNTNVIVLQYVISHFYNTGQIKQIKQFFVNLVKKVVKKKSNDEPLIILINDVNSCYRGRNFFEDFTKILSVYKHNGYFWKFYFDYRIQNDSQRYGEKHQKNNTLFNLDDIDLDIYDPWKECSSAQMLIEID